MPYNVYYFPFSDYAKDTSPWTMTGKKVGSGKILESWQ